MMFAKRLREGVRRGEITCSVRIWKGPRVRVRGRYRMEEGEIEVDSIEPIGLPDITPELARQSGFRRCPGSAQSGQAWPRREDLSDPFPLHLASPSTKPVGLGRLRSSSRRIRRSVSWNAAALTFSSRCWTELVPGMSRVTGERRRSQASETTAVDTLRAAAIFSTTSFALRACAIGPQGMKAIPLACAIVEHDNPTRGRRSCSGSARRRWGRSCGRARVLEGDVGERDVADLALLLETREGFHGGIEGTGGVGDVELIDVNAVEAEALEASCDGLLQCGRGWRCAARRRRRGASSRPWW